MRYMVTVTDRDAEPMTVAVCRCMDDALDTMRAHVEFDGDMHTGREYSIMLEEDDDEM